MEAWENVQFFTKNWTDDKFNIKNWTSFYQMSSFLPKTGQMPFSVHFFIIN